jgi:purine nucleosidase
MSVTVDRRLFVGSAMACLASLPTRAMAGPQPLLARMILDNDFAGDPDGLFQLAHHALCRSVRIALVVGSHFPARFGSGHDAADSAASAREVLSLIKRDGAQPIVAGSETPIASRAAWKPGAAAAAIVREAMRDDVHEPLVYAAGAGLTDLALAWLSEPRIGRRIKLIWIGGNPHPDFGSKVAEPEFNFSIDPIAAQVLFNESDIEIWQVPSDTYTQMIFSTAELEELAATGPLGAYLKARVDSVPAMLAKLPGMPAVPMNDVYVLGDSPLVTLSALLPPMRPEPTSSRYRTVPTPRLSSDGSYVARPDGRAMRVYTEIDAGLTFRDMMARFRIAARSPAP